MVVESSGAPCPTSAPPAPLRLRAGSAYVAFPSRRTDPVTYAPPNASRALRAAGAALVALTALAGGAAHAQETGTAELEALYWARQDSALAQYTDADVHFMAGMVGHHAQALVMSAMAPTHGASPSVRRLAARIMNAQRDEIQTMQRWLTDRGHPAPEVRPDGTMAMDHDMGYGADHGGMDHGDMNHGGMDHDAGGAGMDHGQMEQGGAGMDPAVMDHSTMPGMLSPAQLAELDAARGVDFDRLFLAYMIQHHGGAIVMVDDLFGADGAAQEGATFKLASDIQVDQRTEIARMQQMLDAIVGDG